MICFKCKLKLIKKYFLVNTIFHYCTWSLTVFRMGLFEAAQGKGERGAYPTMMKLGSYTLPKEDPKNI